MDLQRAVELDTYILENEFYLASEAMVRLPELSKRKEELIRDIGYIVFELNCRELEDCDTEVIPY